MDAVFESWWERAVCRGQDASYFFAPSYFEKRAEKQAREAVAKALCVRCPVREPCLEFALATNQDSGIWGGTSEEERRKLRKQYAARQRRTA